MWFWTIRFHLSYYLYEPDPWILLQALEVMDITFHKKETCLFANHYESEQELASIYLHGYPYSLDKYEEKIGKLCENGTAEERELYRYMIEYFDDQLLRVRNSQWAPKIIRLLREEPNSYFFAFGAAHFRGKHRIQKFLEEAGFKVEHVGPDDPLNHEPKTEYGFWNLLDFVSGVWGSFLFVSILLHCSQITSPDSNTEWR